jgi:hypothetical protein
VTLSSRGPGHRPFTAVTRVRIPLGSPGLFIAKLTESPRFYLAGGAWSGVGRTAVVQLCTQEEDADVNIKLFGAIRTIFDQQTSDKLTTKQIIEELVAMENGPWALMFEEALRFGRLQTAASRLARMLNDFKICPRTIRIGSQTPKGFHRSEFEEAWKRYLPATEKAATSATSETHHRRNVAAVASVAASAAAQDEDSGLDL